MSSSPRAIPPAPSPFEVTRQSNSYGSEGLVNPRHTVAIQKELEELELALARSRQQAATQRTSDVLRAHESAPTTPQAAASSWTPEAAAAYASAEAH